MPIIYEQKEVHARAKVRACKILGGLTKNNLARSEATKRYSALIALPERGERFQGGGR